MSDKTFQQQVAALVVAAVAKKIEPFLTITDLGLDLNDVYKSRVTLSVTLNSHTRLKAYRTTTEAPHEERFRLDAETVAEWLLGEGAAG